MIGQLGRFGNDVGCEGLGRDGTSKGNKPVLSVARSGTQPLKENAYVPADPHRLLMPVPALPNPNLLYWRKAVNNVK